MYRNEYQEIQTSKNPPLKSALKKSGNMPPRDEDENVDREAKLRLREIEDEVKDKVYLGWIVICMTFFALAAVWCLIFIENPPNDPMNKKLMIFLIMISVVAGYTMGLLGYMKKSEEYTRLYRLVLISHALFQFGILGVASEFIITLVLVSEPIIIYSIYRNYKLSAPLKEYEKLKKELRRLIGGHHHQHTKNCRH